MIPKKKMVLKNKTITDLGIIPLDFPIKMRIKEFAVQHKDGSIHKRGPCLSLQQFNRKNHFLSAISIELKDFEYFLKILKARIKKIRDMAEK